MHTDHAASRRLSRASLIGSIFLVSVVSVFPAIHCDSLQFTAFVIWRARTILVHSRKSIEFSRVNGGDSSEVHSRLVYDVGLEICESVCVDACMCVRRTVRVCVVHFSYMYVYSWGTSRHYYCCRCGQIDQSSRVRCVPLSGVSNAAASWSS